MRIIDKKILTSIFTLGIMLSLVSCGYNSRYMAYAVVHFGDSLDPERIVFGDKYTMNYQSSTVYHYDKRKKSIQIQPSKNGNIIFNVDATWTSIKSFESIGNRMVYYIENEGFIYKFIPINDSEIEVNKIIVHKPFMSSIIIEEIYVINVNDIEAFDFSYKIEDLS